MFTSFTKKFGFVLGCLAAIAIFVVIAAVSWILTCGLVYLISLCFGWTFSWGIATGVWFLMRLLKSVFSSNVTVKKQETSFALNATSLMETYSFEEVNCMNNIFKNFGKTFVVLGSTILQLTALVLRFIGLVFDTIGLGFRTASTMLMNLSTFLLGKIGFAKTQTTEEETNT